MRRWLHGNESSTNPPVEPRGKRGFSAFRPSSCTGGREFDFVNPNGNDTNPGTKDKPLKTLAGAAQRVNASTGSGTVPGDRAKVRPGEITLCRQ